VALYQAVAVIHPRVSPQVVVAKTLLFRKVLRQAEDCRCKQVIPSADKYQNTARTPAFKPILKHNHNFISFGNQGQSTATNRGLLRINHKCDVYSHLGGVVVSMLATGPKGCGFKTRPRRWMFKGDKNPQHTFQSDVK
jgi:hypothetical protein